jgi:hypothetical protein
MKPKRRVVNAWAVIDWNTPELKSMYAGMKGVFLKEEQAKASVDYDYKLAKLSGNKMAKKLRTAPITITYTA